MALPITIPNTFANATTSIPLSQLDNNFSTVVVAINGIGNGAEALANVNITGGTVANVNLSTSNVNITGGNVNITTLTATTGNITTVNATTVNGTTVDTTNIEVTNIKAKDGTAAFVISDSSGNVNFDSNTLFVNASSNRVGIGTTTTDRKLSIFTDGSEWPVQSRVFLATDNNRPTILQQRAKGSQASPTGVGNGTYLGGLSVGGYDGTNWSEGYNGGVELIVEATQTWTGSNRGSQLICNITPNNTTSPATLFTGTQDKYLRMASGTGGIQFNGDTAAANALDDYEEGDWTPSIPGLTLTSLLGKYVKIGNTVTYWGALSYSSGTCTSPRIEGLPFSTNSSNRSPVGISQADDVSWGSGATMLVGFVSNTGIDFFGNVNNAPYISITASQFVKSGTFIEFGGSYTIY